MARHTLLDFYADLSQTAGDFVVYDDGYRAWTFTYGEIAAAAAAFAGRLRAAAIGTDSKVVLWSENRAEWLAVLWGCLLEGVVLVPVDYRSPAELVLRIAEIVDAKAIVVGETVEAPQTPRPVWPIRQSTAPQSPNPIPHSPSPSAHSPSRTPIPHRPRRSPRSSSLPAPPPIRKGWC